MTRARNGAAPVAPRGPAVDSLIDGTPNGGWARIDGHEVEHHGAGVISVDGGERVETFAPRRSGKTQSKAARRASGRVRREVWLTEEQARRLAWIRDEDGHDYAQIVGGHIDAEWEERNR